MEKITRHARLLLALLPLGAGKIYHSVRWWWWWEGFYVMMSWLDASLISWLFFILTKIAFLFLFLPSASLWRSNRIWVAPAQRSKTSLHSSCAVCNCIRCIYIYTHQVEKWKTTNKSRMWWTRISISNNTITAVIRTRDCFKCQSILLVLYLILYIKQQVY